MADMLAQRAPMASTDWLLHTSLQFYDVPSVSLAAAVYHLMAAGVDAFKVQTARLAFAAKHFFPGISQHLSLKPAAISVTCRLKSMCGPQLTWAGSMPKRKSSRCISTQMGKFGQLHVISTGAAMQLEQPGSTPTYTQFEPSLGLLSSYACCPDPLCLHHTLYAGDTQATKGTRSWRKH